MINLGDNERLDDLQRCGYRIIQNTRLFCFGIDAVLLSDYANVLPGDKVLDMCSGNGVVPMLLKARYTQKAESGVFSAAESLRSVDTHFTGLEILADNVDLARRSIEYNKIEDSVDMVCGDVKEASALFGGASFDVITCNPPYMNENGGLINPSDNVAIARHEILCSLEDIIREAGRLLKTNGRFYLIHRPHRLVDIMVYMRQYRIEPKRMRMVLPFAGKKPTMVLIEGVRGGKIQLNVEPPLITYDKPGEYTREVLDIYGRD